MFKNMTKNMNIFSVLAEYNEYDDFEDIMPYSEILNGGKWRSLKRSPVANLVEFRFGNWYDGKLTIYELNTMKEKIENKRKSLENYREKMRPRLSQLHDLIREQSNLCSEGAIEHMARIDNVLISATISSRVVDTTASLYGFFQQVDEVNMMKDIISFITPTETCAQRLQKHLNECTGDGTGNYKCTQNRVCYNCEFKDDGRCHHYYEIERAKEDLEGFEYYEEQCQEKINDLEYQYEKALAVKENRLKEYYESDLEDDYWS